MSTYADSLLAAANAEFDAAVDSDKQKAAETALGGDKPAAPEGENGFVRWTKKLPKNIGVGLLDAALNTLDAVQPDSPEVAEEGAPQGAFTAGMYTPPQSVADKRMGLMDDEHGQAISAVKGFRDEMALGSRVSDHITQGVAQFVVPFTGWMKAFSGARAAASAPKLAQVAGKIGQAVGAESATMATAFDPHAGRLADLVEFGKHTEGRFADALNVVAPDGSAVNAYFDYMSSREDESDAEGRFKNVVDSLVASAAIASVLKVGAKSFRSARAFAESPITLPEIGAPEHIAMRGQQLADEALAKFPESQHAAMVDLTEQADNILDDAERETVLAARDKVAQGLPEQGYTVVPSPEGHTVVSGKQPIMTFEKEEDAIAAVADAQKLLGTNFQQRAAAEHAKSSDANFGTLHAFSRVLKSNVDRPVSTHSLLSSLERNIKGDTEQGAFYKELLGRLVRKKVAGMTTVSSKAGRTPDTAGHFATAFNSIELFDRAFKSPKELLHTFTHEAVHAATMHEMNASARVMAQMEKLRKAAFDVPTQQRATVAKGLKSFGSGEAPTESVSADDLIPAHAQGKYGFTNAYEFVAEIESNPEFRKLMQKTKLPDGGTAWDEYLKTIAGILGVGALVATPAGQKEFSKLMMGPKQENDVG